MISNPKFAEFAELHFSGSRQAQLNKHSHFGLVLLSMALDLDNCSCLHRAFAALPILESIQGSHLADLFKFI